MRVHINEIKGKKAGYKIRWTEDGKPKEAFRKEYKDATALQASVRERFIGDSNEEYRKTHLSDSQLKEAEAAPSLHKDYDLGVPTSPLRFYLRGEEREQFG